MTVPRRRARAVPSPSRSALIRSALNRSASVLAILGLALGATACSQPADGEANHEGPEDRILQEAADGGPVAGVDGSGTEMDAAATEEAPSPKRPPPAPIDLPDDDSRPRFQRPDSLKGVYINAWGTGSIRKMERFFELARRTEINAFVLDMKDATGYVSYASGVPAIRESGALGEIRVRDLPGLLRRLESEGVYPIARIVIVKDPVLVEARPDLAVQDTAGGPWIDSKEIRWLNLYNEGVWEYHTDLAMELAQLGFPEIQWDYVRFPDAPASDMERAVFPGDSLGPRRDAVRAFLGYARERLDSLGLGVRMTADVFGVTTTFRRDVGIGQVWESFIDQVDAALPMVYPSHYWDGSYGYREPNAFPYEVVKEALDDALRRTDTVEGAGDVIPWLQDFTLGPPRYGPAEVRAQIQATYDAGLKDWILWNPSSNYSEEALEPVIGFHLEPLVRVGGEIVPVSDRFNALERFARAEFVKDSLEALGADSPGAVKADTAAVGNRD